VLQTENTLVI